MSILNIFSQKKPIKSLKEFKEKNGYTQKQLAEELGISQSYISLYFTGRRGLGKKVAKRISKITGIPLENLL